jgi:hypothetical protein
MLDYFIQYKITPGAEAKFIPVMVAMQSEVLRLTGVRGRIKQSADQPEVWLEMYEGVHQRMLFEAGLQEAEERFGIAQYLAPGSARRTALFTEPI